MKKLKIVEINSEIGAGTRGASLGIGAMKTASLNLGSDFFMNRTSLVVQNENHLLFTPDNSTSAKNIEGLKTVIGRLSDSIKTVLKDDFFPVVLAGDHSTAAGTIAGIKSTYPEKRLGVIWIDAHADLHSPYTTPTGNMHGMPLAISLAEDNLANKVNDIPEEIADSWKALQGISGTSPALSYTDLVFLGVRDTEQQENDIINRNNIKKYTVSEVRIQGIDQIVQDTRHYLQDCDLIYISFDVDSMDPTYVSHGTGTPVPVGFSEGEATQLLLGLLDDPKICCFEVTEVNPTLDEKGNVMGETAFRILERTTSALEKKN